MVETQFNAKIKQFQSDWGGEYRNVSTYLETQGINHQISCPHTQSQNGAAERRHRTIVEKGLALLHHSNLPTSFWEHAFHTSVYLHNRTITPILNFQSPFEVLYNKIPDYKFLKSFGCLCYPFLRPYNSNKLEFRSSPCIFIGYSSKHKGYLCLHVPTNRVYVAHHVMFDENTFPYHLHARDPTDNLPTPSAPHTATSPSLLQLVAFPWP